MSKSSRRRARETAVQGIYAWLLAGESADRIAGQLAEHDSFAKMDEEHFAEIFGGAIREADDLRAVLQPYLDRPVVNLSPVEHAVLLVGAYELKHLPEIPYRVVINEAVEVAKTFGGVEGYKYVNGVLDKAAGVLRPSEARR